MKNRLLLALVGFAATVSLTGCPSNNQVVLPPPGSTPLALFAGSASTHMLAFALPFTSSSTASVSLAGFGTADSVAFDQSGHLFVLDNGPTPPVLYQFNRPVTSSSSPTATIAVTGTSSCVFATGDASGNLWVSCATPAEVVEISGPFTATGSYSGTIGATLTGMSFPRDLAFDGSGNLFVADSTGSVVAVFKSPVATGTPSGTLTASTPEGVAVDAAGNVYANNDGDNSLRRWNAPVPLTTSGVAASVIDPSTSTGFTGSLQGMTFDGNGNLYVGTCGSSIIVFALSGGLTTSTTPAFTNSSTGCIWDVDSHLP